MHESEASRLTTLTVLGFCVVTPYLALGMAHPRLPGLDVFHGGLSFVLTLSDTVAASSATCTCLLLSLGAA